jgi:Immunity protein Imm1
VTMRLEYVVPVTADAEDVRELDVDSPEHLDRILDAEDERSREVGLPLAVHLFSGNDDKATLIFTIGADRGFVRWWAEDMWDSQGDETTDEPHWPYLYNGSPAAIERSKLIPQEQVRAAVREFLVSGGQRPDRVRWTETG